MRVNGDSTGNMQTPPSLPPPRSGEASSDAIAVVLFDGVCHLCDGVVRWILAHDHDARFRFASLQSSAAARMLGERGAGALPDSIVLLDAGGVHVRSDAALRVVAHLGFPWSWLQVLRWLPRPVRDGLYASVARRRYSWFGRRDVCVRPTPALRSRFLDADEPATPQALALPDAPAASSAGPASWILAWTTRLLPIYLVLYALPFPIGTIPGTEPGEMWLARVYELVVQPLGRWWLHRDIVFAVTGSGDSTFAYLLLVVQLALAAIVAAAATAMARGAPLDLRANEFGRLYLRYWLCGAMFSYGWIKVFGLQMSAPGPDRLIENVGSVSPMGLLWTFMGASATYQAFAGACEVLGGGLLLFGRTAVLGALTSAAVMTNVFVLNLSYDVPVKLFSGHLLFVALWLAAPHAARLAAVLVLQLPSPAPVAASAIVATRPWVRWSWRGVRLSAVLFLAIVPAVTAAQEQARRQRLERESPLHGVYDVVSISGQPAIDFRDTDGSPWRRVGINAVGPAAVVRQSGAVRRFFLTADEEARTVTYSPLFFDEAPITLTYTLVPPDGLRLHGQISGEAVVVDLRRLPAATSVLMDRGFHWINEHPFNR